MGGACGEWWVETKNHLFLPRPRKYKNHYLNTIWCKDHSLIPMMAMFSWPVFTLGSLNNAGVLLSVRKLLQWSAHASVETSGQCVETSGQCVETSGQCVVWGQLPWAETVRLATWARTPRWWSSNNPLLATSTFCPPSWYIALHHLLSHIINYASIHSNVHKVMKPPS